MLIDFGATATSASDAMEPDIKKGLLLLEFFMGKQSHRVRASPPTEMKTTWSFYYWDEAYVNKDSETLKTCMERYGVGGWYSIPKDMVAALITETLPKVVVVGDILNITGVNIRGRNVSPQNDGGE